MTVSRPWRTLAALSLYGGPQPDAERISYKTLMTAEPSPLENGLLAGREYAVRASDDRVKLRRVAQSRNAADTRAAIDWSLIEAPDEEQPDAFWSGFMHGVREYLVGESKTLPGAD